MSKTYEIDKRTHKRGSLVLIAGLSLTIALGVALQTYAINQGPDGDWYWATLAYLTLLLAGHLTAVILFWSYVSKVTFVRRGKRPDAPAETTENGV